MPTTEKWRARDRREIVVKKRRHAVRHFTSVDARVFRKVMVIERLIIGFFDKLAGFCCVYQDPYTKSSLLERFVEHTARFSPGRIGTVRTSWGKD